MDAPPSSSERTRELASLRSRAYGRDADIHLDADALARLVELEELARTDATESVSVSIPEAVPGAAHASKVDPVSAPAAVEAAGPNGKAAVDPAGTAVPTGAGDTADRPEPQPEARRPRWWRRVPTWALIGGAAIVGLVVGLAVPAVTAPQPDAVLRPIPLDGAVLDDQGFGFNPGSQVRFEPFHDLEVWSGESSDGALCVFVVRGGDEWVAIGCGPAELPPTADLTLHPMMPAIDGLDLPDASVVRFMLHDGVIDVWIVPMGEKA